MQRQVNLKVKPHKLRRLELGQTVQLDRDELGNDSDDCIGECNVEKPLHTKIRKARRLGKGLRISGGKISWKRIGSKVADGIETVKRVIPKSTARTALGDMGMAVGTVAGMYLGNPEVGAKIGKTIGQSSVDATYSTDFKKRNALNTFGNNIGSSMVSNGMSNIASGGSLDYIVLDNSIGVQGKVFKNGNPLLRNTLSSESIYNLGISVKNDGNIASTIRHSIPSQYKPISDKVINMTGGSFKENGHSMARRTMYGGSFSGNGGRS